MWWDYFILFNCNVDNCLLLIRKQKIHRDFLMLSKTDIHLPLIERERERERWIDRYNHISHVAAKYCHFMSVCVSLSCPGSGCTENKGNDFLSVG